MAQKFINTNLTVPLNSLENCSKCRQAFGQLASYLLANWNQLAVYLWMYFCILRPPFKCHASLLDIMGKSKEKSAKMSPSCYDSCVALPWCLYLHFCWKMWTLTSLAYPWEQFPNTPTPHVHSMGPCSRHNAQEGDILSPRGEMAQKVQLKPRETAKDLVKIAEGNR